MADFMVFAYPILLEKDEDGRFLATCRDLPEVATDGADQDEALANAADAVDVAVRERLRREEAVPSPSRRSADETAVGLDHVTAYRVALLEWAREEGRGAQRLLAQRLDKGETHVRRLFAPTGGARVESLVEALRVIGRPVAPSLSLTMAGHSTGVRGETRQQRTGPATRATN